MGSISKRWLSGDGGPLIIIQGDVAPLWQGAVNFENSLMAGGEIETDYDIICEGNETRVIIRYERDMVVLDDSSWPGIICALPSGVIVAFQPYGYDGWDPKYDLYAIESPEYFNFKVESETIRLLVGADDGLGDLYGFRDVPIAPGHKRCTVSQAPDRCIVVIAAPDYVITVDDCNKWRHVLLASG